MHANKKTQDLIQYKTEFFAVIDHYFVAPLELTATFKKLHTFHYRNQLIVKKVAGKMHLHLSFVLDNYVGIFLCYPYCKNSTSQTFYYILSVLTEIPLPGTRNGFNVINIDIV